jgi:two-component system, sporulation sensor kinase D
MKVLGSKDQLKQVVLNITKNALEAMPNGGKLMLKLRNVNNRALISVIDSGVGISNDELKKILTILYF